MFSVMSSYISGYEEVHVPALKPKPFDTDEVIFTNYYVYFHIISSLNVGSIIGPRFLETNLT